MEMEQKIQLLQSQQHQRRKEDGVSEDHQFPKR